MIELYSGTPGSGKSYHAVERVYNRSIMGRSCICNFPVCFSKNPFLPWVKTFKRSPLFVRNEDLTVDYLIRYAAEHHHGGEGETLLVIDEAGLFFNSRDWSKPGRRSWLDFFSQHRKLGFDVVLIAQSVIMVDKQIRAFIEEDHRHRKLSRLGIWGIWLRPFSTFLSVIYWNNTVRLGTENIKYRKFIADCYDTKMVFNNGN